jgi:diadenosine tetraphosphatase ApaH/serine/threonine PP2A family protein phosphatase
MHFNFRDECLQKYDQEIYLALMDAFDCLPIAACVNNKYVCMHAGISPQLHKLEDIMGVDRFQEVPKEGLACDLVWSDPTGDFDGKFQGGRNFELNRNRGCSHLYGYKACRKFLDNNGFYTIIRAHEVQEKGFKCHHWGEASFPAVITVFSAPNYCDTYGNIGAVIHIKKGVLDIKQFHFQGHPYFLPNGMDSVEWSISLVASKVTELFAHLNRLTEGISDHPLTPAEEESFQKLLKTGKLNDFLIKDHRISGSDLMASNLTNWARQSELLGSRTKEQIESLRRIDLNGEIISMSEMKKTDDLDGHFTTMKRLDSMNEIRPFSIPNSPMTMTNTNPSLKVIRHDFGWDSINISESFFE